MPGNSCANREKSCGSTGCFVLFDFEPGVWPRIRTLSGASEPCLTPDFAVECHSYFPLFEKDWKTAKGQRGKGESHSDLFHART